MTLHAFDLIVLGALVSVGGALFLAKAYWSRPHSDPPEGRQVHQHLHALAGVRWLTVGAIALVLGVTRGEAARYFIGPWSDALIHTVVLSMFWVATGVRTQRLTRKGLRPPRLPT